MPNSPENLAVLRHNKTSHQKFMHLSVTMYPEKFIKYIYTLDFSQTFSNYLETFLKNLSLLQKQNVIIIKLFGIRTNF
jgi:hypothetical protein